MRIQYQRIQYQRELELLHQELAQLGGLCADAIEETCQALRTGVSDIYRAAKDRGDQIRDLERTAEGRCIQLLLLQQPAATRSGIWSARQRGAASSFCSCSSRWRLT